jgi:MATE family multidrug resistance protein
MFHLADLRREFRPMLRLAAPLALAELGWMAMGIVDTIMAGPLGPAAVGAGILGNMVFYPLATSLTGLLLGMDTFVAQAYGRGDARDSRHTLINGIWLSIALTPITMLLIMAAIPGMRAVGANPRVMEQCAPYMRAMVWGMLPLFLFTAFRRYLQALNLVKAITFTLITANLINFFGNFVLIYGRFGAPQMGLAGSGWSTSLSRVYMAGVLLGTIVWEERRSGRVLWKLSWRPDWGRLRELVRLGLPATGQIALEGAVFGVVTLMAAKLDEVSLAAHGIAVQVISTTFMVPLGISSAAAVRVGHAVGRGDRRGAAAAGWSALLIAALFMSAAGIALWTVPRLIVRLFIGDAAVILAGVTLLRIAAFFELFDGLQVVATGALRGIGDTRSPMLTHFVGYWVVGMPVVYVLCFTLAWGARGIWIGLSAALILIGAALVVVWKARLSPVRSSTARL